MRYLDTSVLVPLFVPEPGSDSVRRWFGRAGKAPAPAAAISEWAVVEFVSAIGLKVRRKEIAARQGVEVVNLFRRFAADSTVTINAAHGDYADAAALLMDFPAGLRAGDALHLALARAHGCESLVTLDRAFASAARRLRFPVERPA